MSDYADFAANTPLATQPQQPSFLQKAGDFATNAAKGIAQPFFKLGAMAGNAIVGTAQGLGLTTPQQDANIANIRQNGLQNTPFGTVDIPSVDVSQSPFSSKNIQAIKSSAGTGIQIGADLVGGGEGEGLVEGGIKQGIIQGAKGGAVIGGAQGLGQSLSNNSGVGDTIKNTLMGVGVGGVTGGVTGGVSNIWSKAYGETGGIGGYQANLDEATANANQVGAKAADSITEASGVQDDVKTGLGNQFAQAPEIITKADPNAGTTLTADFMAKLNALKESKTFVLPESLKDITPNIADGTYKLNPQQTQDLMTQLDALTYKAKASGDLAINQQSIGLAQELKNSAQTGMGHVTNAQGNSVWSKAYEDYHQGMNARDTMSSLIPTKNSPGEMLDPVKVQASVDKMTKMMETPSGRAALEQGNAQYKAATGYDILHDPMGSIQKMIDSNQELQDAIKGGYMKQLQRAVTSPTKVGSRLLYLTSSILGIAALGTAFRKQIGSFFTGQ